MYIASQIISLIAFVIYFFSLQIKSKSFFTVAQISTSILYGISYFLLHSMSGFVLACLGIMRFIMLYLFQKKKLASSLFNYFIAIISAVFILVVIYFWTSPFDIFILLAHLIVNVAYYLKNIKHIKIAYIFVSICFIIFTFNLKSYVVVVTECLNILSVIIFLIRMKKTEKLENIKKEKHTKVSEQH